MIIVIETQGDVETKISINGTPLEHKIQEFNFTVRAGRKPKLVMIQELEGKRHLTSLFAEDFKKYDVIDAEQKSKNSK